MDERAVMDFISSLGNKVSKLENLEKQFENLEKKLDITHDRVIELKTEYGFLKSDSNEIKAKLKCELDILWNELRKLKEESLSTFKNYSESSEKDLKSHVENRIFSLKVWILTSSVSILFIAVTYFLSKVFNNVIK